MIETKRNMLEKLTGDFKVASKVIASGEAQQIIYTNMAAESLEQAGFESDSACRIALMLDLSLADSFPVENDEDREVVKRFIDRYMEVQFAAFEAVGIDPFEQDEQFIIKFLDNNFELEFS